MRKHLYRTKAHLGKWGRKHIYKSYGKSHDWWLSCVVLCGAVAALGGMTSLSLGMVGQVLEFAGASAEVERAFKDSSNDFLQLMGVGLAGMGLCVGGRHLLTKLKNSKWAKQAGEELTHLRYFLNWNT